VTAIHESSFTFSGVEKVTVIVPSPTSPPELLPQHHALPSLASPQVCVMPTAIEVHFNVVITGVGRSAAAFPPVPSSPAMFEPKHEAVPSPVSVHTWVVPTATCAQVAVPIR